MRAAIERIDAAIERGDQAEQEENSCRMHDWLVGLSIAVVLVWTCERVWKLGHVYVWQVHEVEVETVVEKAGESVQAVQHSLRFGGVFDCFPLSGMRDVS